MRAPTPPVVLARRWKSKVKLALAPPLIKWRSIDLHPAPDSSRECARTELLAFERASERPTGIAAALHALQQRLFPAKLTKPQPPNLIATLKSAGNPLSAILDRARWRAAESCASSFPRSPPLPADLFFLPLSRHHDLLPAAQGAADHMEWMRSFCRWYERRRALAGERRRGAFWRGGRELLANGRASCAGIGPAHGRMVSRNRCVKPLRTLTPETHP